MVANARNATKRNLDPQLLTDRLHHVQTFPGHRGPANNPVDVPLQQ